MPTLTIPMPRLVKWQPAEKLITRAWVNALYKSRGYGPRSKARRRADVKRIRREVFALLLGNLNGLTGSKLSSAVLGVANGLTGVVLMDAVYEGALVRKRASDNDHTYRLSVEKWVEMEAAQCPSR